MGWPRTQVIGNLCRSGASSFPGDELADSIDSSRVKHLFGTDPPAARGANTEAHLPAESLRSMAIAVDGQGHPRGSRPASDASIHVEMSGGAIDFHRGVR